MIECTEIDDLVEARIDRAWTQYRESPKLLEMTRIYLREIAEATRATCEIISFFDIDTAVGDQLTIIGKALGWPRCHCRGQRRPVFGLVCMTPDECGPPVVPIGGLCEAEFDCGGPDYVEFCFTDDELYRGFLKARRWAIAEDCTHHGITMAAREVFGPGAVIYRDGDGVIEVTTGRWLTGIEISIVHLYEQVLPIPPGVKLVVSHSNGPPFGIGDGWGGLCNGYFPTVIPVE